MSEKHFLCECWPVSLGIPFIHEVTHTYVQDYFIVEGTIIINRLLLLTSNFVPVL